MTVDLRPGSQVAKYRIETVIGRGGMGVVYLATETGLERPVALKVLAPEWASDERSRSRFERESRLAASIDHPNIVPIYDAGHDGDVLWIAMRYVDGTDLKQEIVRRGRIELGPALGILRQIAAALDAAHARGLVHRDVKPGNILIEDASALDPAGGRSTGTPIAYLTDFGLTRRPEDAPTMSSPGAFVGSIAYAAPEQIEAKPLDGRADQYALACVLFHALAGRPPFDREFDVAAMRAHLADPPPSLTEHVADLPEDADAVLARGLAKDPAARFPTCAAFVTSFGRAAGLTDAGYRPSVPGPGGRPGPKARTGRARRLVAVASAVALVAVVAVVSAGGGTVHVLGQALPGLIAAAVSPDGSRVAFVTDFAGNRDIFSMALDGSDRIRLTKSPASDRNLSWSRDGTRIAFTRISGGDGDIYSMNADGTDVRDLTRDPADDRNPVWSPDGTRIAFVRSVGQTGDVMVMDTDGSGLRQITSDPADERDPVWSPDGEHMVFIGDTGGAYQLFAIPVGGGTPTQLTRGPHDERDPGWSPDGRTIAFLQQSGRGVDVFTMPSAGGSPIRLTDTSAPETAPIWSPDGTLLVFSRPDGPDSHIYVIGPDGAGLRALTAGAFVDHAPEWARGDPERVVFVRAPGP